MPVSLRTQKDTAWGNRISLQRLTLPVGEPDPGTCDIGINIDTAAVPDPDVLLACLQDSFAEITALGATGPVPAKPATDPAGLAP
jgi:hypothetical protein